MSDVEETRARFRPDRILTLFVGEFAPVSGDFFYDDYTAMTRHMRRAVERHHGPTDNFLQTFKSYGWFLDDLVLVPVNQMSPRERRLACVNAREGLAARIMQYQPQAIISLLRSIADDVEISAHMARSEAKRYVVSFPGNGHQGKFHAGMMAILPLLPRIGIRSK